MRLSSKALAVSETLPGSWGKGIEFLGEVAEAGIPSLVFGGDTGSVGCATAVFGFRRVGFCPFLLVVVRVWAQLKKLQLLSTKWGERLPLLLLLGATDLRSKQRFAVLRASHAVFCLLPFQPSLRTLLIVGVWATSWAWCACG